MTKEVNELVQEPVKPQLMSDLEKLFEIKPQLMSDLEKFFEIISEKNKKINTDEGGRKIELSAKGWKFGTNCDKNPESISEGINYSLEPYKDGGKKLKIRIEPTAYDSYGRTLPSHVAIYVRGVGIKPIVSPQVIREAKHYLNLKPDERRSFLIGVYKQICKGSGGSYKEQFERMAEHITPILNYFVEKMRVLGLTTEANNLEVKIKERFPLHLKDLSLEYH